MADVQSKNMYAVLGNDSDQDSDREPAPPTKAIDKTLPRSAKRDAPDTAPARATAGEGRGRGGRGGRGGGRGGSEGAFQDRDAGSTANRSRGYVEQTDRPYRGGRGDRPPRGPHRGRDGRDDRHSHGRPNEHVKQADQSWGAQTGGSEWDDEKAGEEIAKAEAKEGFDTSVNAPVNADGEKPDGESGQAENVPSTEPAEPEDRSKSYDAYLAEQAEKRMNLGGVLKARKPNEGNKIDKKWASAKPINQDDNEEAYIAGKEAKAGRQRERKEKQTLEIDYRYQEQSRGERGGRGGRGRGEFRGGDRGGRGESRGGDRGGRGDRGRGRGDFRGGDFRGSDFRGGDFRGGDFRGGDFRGGRGGGRGRGDNVNISDETAFPSLGA